jgi:hypothetical protein
MVKRAFDRKKTLLAIQLDFHLRKKLVNLYIWSIPLHGAETWTLWNVDEEHVESLEMWCWKGKKKISWTNSVRNEGLCRVKEETNILHM